MNVRVLKRQKLFSLFVLLTSFSSFGVEFCFTEMEKVLLNSKKPIIVKGRNQAASMTKLKGVINERFDQGEIPTDALANLNKVLDNVHTRTQDGFWGDGLYTCLDEYSTNAFANLFRVVGNVRKESAQNTDLIFNDLVKGYQETFKVDSKKARKSICQMAGLPIKNMPNSCRIFGSKIRNHCLN
jgi:hypothetical protein